MKPILYSMDDVNKSSSRNLFNVVSLFAGGGGSSTGYRLAGGNVLAINEFIPLAQDTYQANYPNTHIFKQDIRQLTGDDILSKIGLQKGELDILDGSPPCSSFSIAGKKEKMWGEVKKYSDSEQRTDDLFFEFARILNDVQPKVFVCENVAGLVSGESKKLLGDDQFSMFGGEENTIYHSLVNCGYNVRYKVLNAKNFCVPQNRERTIFIGVRNDISKKITFPTPTNEIITLGEALNTVECIEMNRKAFGENEPRRVNKNNVCFTVTSDGLGATRRYKVVRHGINPPQKDRANGIDKLFTDSSKSVSPTILANYKGLSNGLVEVEFDDNETTLRKLSIPELKILSSFPNDYILTGSYSKQWERIGRAVPPLMMKAIAEHVYNTILKNLFA
jgi:DNA (cytosine-5)-methyltransferase 1